MPRHELLLLSALCLTACPADDVDGTGGDSSTGSTSTSTTSGGPTSTAGETTQTTATTTVADTGSGSESTTSSDTDAGTDTDAESSTGPAIECNPDVVELPGDMLFPEGIDAHNDGTLYVSGTIAGEILAITPCVEPDEADVVEVFHDGSDTTTPLGVLVDEANEILWVCNSDLMGGTAGSILGFNLDDGTLAWTHAFDAGACNDLAQDDAGNLYATESIASRIMRVPAADLLSDSAAEEWSTDSLYAVDNAGDFGLNGIAFDGTNTLYSVHFTNGEVYRTVIQMNGNAANPNLFENITLEGPDGVEPDGNGSYLIVENAAGQVTRFTPDKGNTTTAVLDDSFDVPTTTVVTGDSYWVVESQFDHLVDPMMAGELELPFVIVRRDLD